MARPIWKGSISFGLVNIPVTLYSGQRQPEELQFHLLDSRNHGRIRYERINEITGKNVPWDKVVKAYAFEKDHYIIVDDKELKKTVAENTRTVQIENFVEKSSIESVYYDKPYYLVPEKVGEKGYVLLREILEDTKTVGIVHVVIKTRQHIAALLPYQDLLLLNILRFSNEIQNPEIFEIPKTNLKAYQLSDSEINMAERLVKSMTVKWEPKKYHDDTRELLAKWVHTKVSKKTKSKKSDLSYNKNKPKAKVIDFMDLLKKSLHEKDKKNTKRRKSK